MCTSYHKPLMQGGCQGSTPLLTVEEREEKAEGCQLKAFCFFKGKSPRRSSLKQGGTSSFTRPTKIPRQKAYSLKISGQAQNDPSSSKGCNTTSINRIPSLWENLHAGIARLPLLSSLCGCQLQTVMALPAFFALLPAQGHLRLAQLFIPSLFPILPRCTAEKYQATALAQGHQVFLSSCTI